MTRNPVGDAEPFSAVYWSAQHNAHNAEAVRSGCTPSKGTGDFDVDVASGTVIVGQSNGETDVSAQTVTLTSPSTDTDLDSGETRVDLVTIDANGTASATEGSPGSGTDADPVVAPDIPAGEVLVAAVTVDGDASSLTSDDINDYRVLMAKSAYAGKEDSRPGSDGSGSGTYKSFDASNAAPLYARAKTETTDSGKFISDIVAVHNDGSETTLAHAESENGANDTTDHDFKSGGWYPNFVNDNPIDTIEFQFDNTSQNGSNEWQVIFIDSLGLFQ